MQATKRPESGTPAFATNAETNRRMYLSHFILILLPLLVLSQSPVAAPAPISYQAGSRAFIEEMARNHDFTRAQVATLMSSARYRQSIIDAISRPYEAKPWRDYRPIFVTAERAQRGVAFWRDNAALLARAQAAFGVPPQIVVAIIGIETNYGNNLGTHRVIDALSTLGFSFPSRADFFRGELEAFLLLAREEDLDPLTVKGSYAGAMGKPQFIASSYRAYAVDFDDDGRRDLWASNADVIGSVSNYLAMHGWQRGQPIAATAVLNNSYPANVAITEKRPVRPDTTLASFAAAGVAPVADFPEPDISGQTRATLMEFDGASTEHWLGFDNFYAITRYNHSNLYAMAVFQLSQEIARRYREAEGH